MKKIAMFLPFAFAATVAGAEVPPEYLAPEWHILANDDARPFGTRVTIDFSEEGRVSGQGPCNRWFAPLDSTLPEFRIGPAGATMMACEDLDKEAAFFAALEKVTRAEVVADKLTLTGPDIEPIVFVRPVN